MMMTTGENWALMLLGRVSASYPVGPSCVLAVLAACTVAATMPRRLSPPAIDIERVIHQHEELPARLPLALIPHSHPKIRIPCRQHKYAHS